MRSQKAREPVASCIQSESIMTFERNFMMMTDAPDHNTTYFRFLQSYSLHQNKLITIIISKRMASCSKIFQGFSVLKLPLRKKIILPQSKNQINEAIVFIYDYIIYYRYSLNQMALQQAELFKSQSIWKYGGTTGYHLHK